MKNNYARLGQGFAHPKNSLPCYSTEGYALKAPAKSGVRIGVLNDCMATHDAPSVFFVPLIRLTYFHALWFKTALLAKLWWAGWGRRNPRRSPYSPVTPTLLSPPPVKLAFPVVVI